MATSTSTRQLQLDDSLSLAQAAAVLIAFSTVLVSAYFFPCTYIMWRKYIATGRRRDEESDPGADYTLTETLPADTFMAMPHQKS